MTPRSLWRRLLSTIHFISVRIYTTTLRRKFNNAQIFLEASFEYHSFHFSEDSYHDPQEEVWICPDLPGAYFEYHSFPFSEDSYHDPQEEV